MGTFNHGSPMLLGKLLGANLNTTSDQAIYLISSNYVVTHVVVTNASATPANAQGGIYTGANKTGSTVTSSAQTYTTLTTATIYLYSTLGLSGTNRLTAPVVYLSLGVAEGSALTADFYLFGFALDT